MFILDEHLAYKRILAPLQKRLKFQRLIEVRPGEQILDDRIPEILLTLNRPTFLTIDQGFWSANWCHPNYAILFFALSRQDEDQLPGLLLDLLRLPPFRNRAERMGKVVRVGQTSIQYWEFGSDKLQELTWKPKGK